MMSWRELVPGVLAQYRLSASDFSVSPVGSGYIHVTLRLSGSRDFVLQRINNNVFKRPDIIAANLKNAASYLAKAHPDFLFLTAIPTAKGEEMAFDQEGVPWRLFPYFDNTYTIDRVERPAQAFSAAAEFGRLTRLLSGVDMSGFRATIEKFHDLEWRYTQFQESLANASTARMQEATVAIRAAEKFNFLVDKYKALISSNVLTLRITHNDTKINNILFDTRTDKAVCAIDLDTLMPGYFIYDVGDMIRTFVSPVDEEERDLSKIVVRPEIYNAVVEGYLSEMGSALSDAERKEISFAGMMMTYIMALRMLTDYLNGDIYYTIRYEGQNLIRATNQFQLLTLLKEF